MSANSSWRSALSPLVVAAASLLALAAASRKASWLFLGWFDWYEEPYFAPLAAEWTGALVISLTILAIATLAASASSKVGSSPVVTWGRHFFLFLNLLAAFLVLQCTMLTAILSEQRGSPGAWEEKFLLLVVGLTAFLWPAAFGQRTDAPTVAGIIIASSLTLIIGAVLLEPFVVVSWQIAFGLRPPIMQGYVPSLPLRELLFLVPVGPVLWCMVQRRRAVIRAAPDSGAAPSPSGRPSTSSRPPADRV